MVIGLDAATWTLIRPWMAEGRMPNLAKLVKAGVGELGFGFEAGGGQCSIGAAAGLCDKGIQEGCLADAFRAAHEHRCTVFSSGYQGSIQLTELGVTPDQVLGHASKIREPGLIPDVSQARR